MAAERVAAKEDDVGRQDERTETNAEADGPGRRIGEPQRQPHVIGEDDDEEQRQIEKVPVDVLEDQRERALAEIRLARLADGARRRIGPERLVVRPAVVIAGEAEAAGRPQDQQRGRKRQGARPPAGLRSEPRVRPLAEEQRRVERRQVRPGLVVSALKGGPRRIHDERGQTEEREHRLDPPGVAPGGLPEPAMCFSQGPRGLSHQVSPRQRYRLVR